LAWTTCKKNRRKFLHPARFFVTGCPPCHELACDGIP
jgi:hypothetical protein